MVPNSFFHSVQDIHAEPTPEVPEEEWDTETSTLQAVKVKETEWDRTKRRIEQVANKNPILRGIWRTLSKTGDVVGNVAGNTGDRVFGETDEALSAACARSPQLTTLMASLSSAFLQCHSHCMIAKYPGGRR